MSQGLWEPCSVTSGRVLAMRTVSRCKARSVTHPTLHEKLARRLVPEARGLPRELFRLAAADLQRIVSGCGWERARSG